MNKIHLSNIHIQKSAIPSSEIVVFVRHRQQNGFFLGHDSVHRDIPSTGLTGPYPNSLVEVLMSAFLYFAKLSVISFVILPPSFHIVFIFHDRLNLSLAYVQTLYLQPLSRTAIENFKYLCTLCQAFTGNANKLLLRPHAM